MRADPSGGYLPLQTRWLGTNAGLAARQALEGVVQCALGFAYSEFLPAGTSGPQADTNFALSDLVCAAAVIFLTNIHSIALLSSCRSAMYVEAVDGGSMFTAEGGDPLCAGVRTHEDGLFGLKAAGLVGVWWKDDGTISGGSPCRMEQ